MNIEQGLELRLEVNYNIRAVVEKDMGGIERNARTWSDYNVRVEEAK